MHRLYRRGLIPFLCVLTVQAALAQTAENLLLVVNEASPVSLEIGQYYAGKRGVAKDDILRVKTSVKESIPREDFESQIESPVAVWLTRNSAQDRILYIVLTKGIPFRIEGSSGRDGTVASVDSELTLLYRKLTGQSAPLPGRIVNPYFLGETPVSQAKPFSHEQYDVFLVCRLDGFTGADVRGLIDRGFAPSREGKILLDQKDALVDKGNTWLKIAAERLREAGFQDRVVLEQGEKVLSGIAGVLGYYSYGSNDPAIRMRHFNLGFVPGALAGMFVSSDARTFVEPPADWQIGAWQDKSTYYAGSPQSLTGDLIRDGVTGIAGHVTEPYLEGTIRPDILFPAYLAGFNLAESYYLAMPSLSWQTIVVGDPLCGPFRQNPLTSDQIEKGTDPETELPRYFSARRVRIAAVTAYKQKQISPDVTKLLLRAEVRMAKRDMQGARRFLEEATSKDKRLPAAQVILASLYEQAGEYDKAIERYRLSLELTPDNPLALNNLAYALAVRRNSPAEALPMAEKAYTLSKANPNITDTLGWIQHLLGDNDRALALLTEASKGAPENAEIRLHLSLLHSARNEFEACGRELARALELNPELAKREDVQQLQKKLAEMRKP